MKRFKVLLIATFLMSLSSMANAMSQYGPTREGESINEVAKKVKSVKGISASKMALVIKVINPQAMKNGTTLKGGALLKIPSSKAEVDQAFKNPAAAQAMSIKSTKAVKAAEPPKAAPKAQAVASVKPEVSAAQNAQAQQNTTQVDIPPVVNKPKPVHAPAPIIIKDQAAIDELKKTFNFEHAERMKMEEKATELSLAARDDEAQIRALEEESNDLKGSFPWSWIWFAALAGLIGYSLYTKRRPGDILLSGGRLAAARLGVTRADPPGSRVHSYPTKKFDENYQQYSLDRRAQGTEGHGAAMAGAMIDIAEGNGNAAEMKLKVQIDKDPENIELRMKLLEVYIEQNNREKFKELADDLLANLISEEDPEWARIQAIYLSKWVYD